MSERALRRKLERAMRARQAVAAGGGGQFGAFDIQRTPRELIADEQDRKRDNLAEDLLKLGLEELGTNSFTDTHRDVKRGEGERQYEDSEPTVTAEAWFTLLAKAALAAATVLYPELPDDEGGA